MKTGEMEVMHFHKHMENILLPSSSCHFLQWPTKRVARPVVTNYNQLAAFRHKASLFRMQRYPIVSNAVSAGLLKIWGCAFSCLRNFCSVRDLSDPTELVSVGEVDL